MKKVYAVKKGKKTGIFYDWDEVKELISGFSGAEYKGFKADDSAKMISLFKQVSLSIINANNLIIVKTLSGNAGTAGMAIDQMNFEEVLGTIAGDDTLLLVTRTNADAETLVKILRNFLNVN